MEAAKAGTRATLVHKAAFAGMMAVLGVCLQAWFASVWPALLELCMDNKALAVFMMCGWAPAVVYWAHSLLLGWRSGWNTLDEHRKVQPVSPGPATTAAAVAQHGLS